MANGAIKLFLMLGLLAASGCMSGDKKAAELLDTARFEEKQHNREHGVRLYNEITTRFPGSAAAKDAAARLAELAPGGTAK